VKKKMFASRIRRNCTDGETPAREIFPAFPLGAARSSSLRARLLRRFHRAFTGLSHRTGINGRARCRSE
jgi:hypothetical protein